MTQEIDPAKLQALAKAHPVAWAMLASEGQWRRAAHLTRLSESLMRLFTGESRRLAISFPPGFGKTLMAVYFMTWWLGQRPQDRVVICSAGESLAKTSAKVAQRALAAFGLQVFGLDVNVKASAVDWRVKKDGRDQRGGILSVGKTGLLTGRRAELMVIDDLFKDGPEADNKTQRDKTWDWFQKVALTRLREHSRCVIIGTRWSHDDHFGRIEQMQRDGTVGIPWDFVNFPAIAEEGVDDPMGREPGQSLWPATTVLDVDGNEEIVGFSEEYLAAQRKICGERTWSALYQGHPTPLDGGLFKRSWFRYATEIGEHFTIEGEQPVKKRECKLFATVDLACSTKTRADWTVIAVWAMHLRRKKLFLIDLKRKRIEGPDIVPLLEKTMREHDLVEIGLEVGSFQNTISQEAARKGLPIRKLVPDKDKITRATASTAPIESGNVYFLLGMPHLNTLETELLTFPQGGHDDCVDVVAYGVIRFLDVLFKTRRRGDDGLGSTLRLS